MNRIAEIKARLAAATQAPWRAKQFRDEDPNPLHHNVSEGSWSVVADDDTSICDVSDDPEEGNARLIAHAPDDLAYLLGRLAEAWEQESMSTGHYAAQSERDQEMRRLDRLARDEARAALRELVRLKDIKDGGPMHPRSVMAKDYDLNKQRAWAEARRIAGFPREGGPDA